MGKTSIFVVRFSPSPNHGEWLNVAAIGEDRQARMVDIGLPSSDRRILEAFGHDVAPRLAAIRAMLAAIATTRNQQLVAETPNELPSLVDAIRDRGLSVQLSDEIVVFGKPLAVAMQDVVSRFLNRQSDYRSEVAALARTFAHLAAYANNYKPSAQIIPDIPKPSRQIAHNPRVVFVGSVPIAADTADLDVESDDFVEQGRNIVGQAGIFSFAYPGHRIGPCPLPYFIFVDIDPSALNSVVSQELEPPLKRHYGRKHLKTQE